MARKRDIPSEVDLLLREYDRKYLDCRDLHHVWVVIGYFNDPKGIARRMECRRCSAVRTQTFGRQYESGGNRYQYPEGYLTEGVRIEGTDVRRAILGSVDVYDSEETLLGSLSARRRRRAAS